MKQPKWWMALAAAVSLAAAPASAGPVEDIISFSSFKQIDLGGLTRGDILTQRGSFSGSQRGLVVQTCFLVPKPVEATAKLLVFWDPTRHPELDVYATRDFTTGDDLDLNGLKFDNGLRPVSLLLNDMLKAKSGSCDLQFNADELKDLRQRMAALPSGSGTDSPAFRKMAADFWASLIKQRYNTFHNGGLAALPHYDYDGAKLSVRDEIKSLASDDPRIAARFQPVIENMLKSGPDSAPSSYYWQFFKADTEAAFAIGAMYTRVIPEKTQIIDCQFYVSNAYFASVTFYELFPVTIGGKESTLIWRADYISAPMFVWLRGVEQMAASMLMMQSIKQSVRIFQADAAK